MLTRTDVRRIALNYNFARNLSEKDKHIDAVAVEINRFSGKRWLTLDARAAETEEAIIKIRSIGGTKFRIVSGTTKLTWFVNPTDWTPFDRLAASAVGVRDIDPLARMRAYYRALDEREFLGTASRIRAHLDPEGLGEVGGERVLEAFADSIDGIAPFPISHNQMIHGVAAFEAIVRSAASGQVERVL